MTRRSPHPGTSRVRHPSGGAPGGGDGGGGKGGGGDAWRFVPLPPGALVRPPDSRADASGSLAGDEKRERGIDLIEKYDGKCSDDYILSFCNFIDISLDEFWDHVRKSANKKLFHVNEDGKIIPKFKVGVGLC